MKAAIAALLGWLLASGTAGAHAGSFILAKAIPDPSGSFTLELTVDYSQHPTLTDRTAAAAALDGVLLVETAGGPKSLQAVANGILTDSTVPDPDLPVSVEPAEALRPHRLLVLRYTWQPDTEEIRFSVPPGNPHDVLFWLAGTARIPGQATLWQVLIAGDRTPVIPVPRPAPATRWRMVFAGLLLSVIGAGLWGRRKGRAGRS